MYPVHKKPAASFSFDRLDMLWERYPQYHEMSTFSTMDALLEEHTSWQEDYEDVREEYESKHYDRFLVQLSWSDLPYRYATKTLIEKAIIVSGKIMHIGGKISFKTIYIVIISTLFIYLAFP